MNKKKIISQLFIIIGIVIVVNLISNQAYFRLDFTDDQRYTLSDATENILNDLDNVITVKAYFSEDLPPQLLNNRREFRDQLVEYENESDGNLVFEFINPNENDEIEREAQQSGVRPIMVNVTDRDQVQQIRAYMGAVLQMEDRTEVIPLIRPNASMEYDLTTAVKKLAIVDKPKLALLQGNGEPGIQAISQLREQLSVLYDLEALSLNDTTVIPSYYKTAIWINPKDTIPQKHFSMLDYYLDQGGNVFLAFSPLSGDLSSQYLRKGNEIGITKWIKSKGVDYGNQYVVDANCASVSVRQKQGFFTINTSVNFPYFPQITNFEEHPITGGLESVLLPFVTNVNLNTSDSSSKVIPLLYSSENTGLISPPTYIDINKQWGQSDFDAESQTLSLAIDGVGGSTGKLVVVANGDFIVNGQGNNQQQLTPDNVNFASNAIDWLSDDTGLIELRTKGITSRPLAKVEDSTKNLIKYGNVFIPIFIILGYAFFRKQMNLKKRQNWLQGKY